jgi:hypothetical protein
MTAMRFARRPTLLTLPAASLSIALLACVTLIAGCAGPAPEAAVQRLRTEDDLARIDELRVRGQVQKLTVQPKTAGAKPYEIVPPDGGHDPSQQRTAKRAVGERVWSIFSF